MFYGWQTLQVKWGINTFYDDGVGSLKLFQILRVFSYASKEIPRAVVDRFRVINLYQTGMVG